MTETEIRKIIEIDASPQIVFAALTNPDDLTQWWPDTAIFEPKVGGKMHLTFSSATHKQLDKDHVLEGEILECVPNKKLVYTFVPDAVYMPDGKRTMPTVVTWNLEEISKNKTRVTLVHSGFTKEMPKQFKETTGGWNYFVPKLVQYCKKKST